MTPKILPAALGLALLLGVAANAQIITGTVVSPVPVAGTTVYSSAYGTTPLIGTPALLGGPIAAPVTTTGLVLPYSYYAAAPLGLPTRIYASYGATDAFPFFGQTYGRPNDPWSWTYMSAYPNPALARYYYPPVP